MDTNSNADRKIMDSASDKDLTVQQIASKAIQNYLEGIAKVEWIPISVSFNEGKFVITSDIPVRVNFIEPVVDPGLHVKRY